MPRRARFSAASCVVAALLAVSVARAEPVSATAGSTPRLELILLTPRFGFRPLPAQSALVPAEFDVPLLTKTTAALAEGSAADAAKQGTPPPALAVDLSKLPVDYNDPDPNRDITNHLRAAAGTFAINWIIWQFDWLSSQREIFFVTHETIVRNFKTGFVYDDNSFKTNFFGHPFHGSMYMGAARGAGLSYWESLPYPWFGSFMWEFTGERHLPSPNDWIATSWGGTVIGEALFRLANEVFDDSLSGSSRMWSEVGGTALSPMYGLQRVTSGRVADDGPPPRRRRRLNADFMVGADRVRLKAQRQEEKFDPGLMVALDVEYGDTLPKKGEDHVDPFEFFDFFTAFNLLQGDVGGSQLFIEAPMYGWNTYLSDPERAHPDNNLFAITQFFDFQSAGIVQFGGAGLGVGDYLVWRSHGLRYRMSANIQGAFLSGATSPFTAATGRTYNFAAGGTADFVSRLDSKTFGEVGIRARQYVTKVIDGEDGNEFTGYVRPWYKLPSFHRFSLGAAATLVNRRGDYEELGTVRGYSFTTELFALFEL